MPELSQGGSSFQNPQAAQGGADAVNDTPTVPGHGTEPEEPVTGTARARVSSGSGIPIVGWIVLALVAIVALVYLIGLF
ncbi:MAG TPA: hypothetical protein VFS44_01235 [Gemmatimonadaceae bacterium]|nr:hypothetical protein [Gemmatimonadaceae bacterium]